MNQLVPSITKRIERDAVSCADHPWVPAVARSLTNQVHGRQFHGQFTLLVTLCMLTRPRSGRVLAERRALAELLSVAESTIGVWLQDLESTGQLAIESGGEYLVLRLRMWPAEHSEADGPKQQNSADPSDEPAGATPPSVPPPSSALHLKVSAPAEQNRAEQTGGVGGPGGEEEGLEEFLDRLGRVIGARRERASYRAFCRRYPRVVLERALDRVAAAGRIRKSKGALFTYLVKKFA